MMMTMKWCVLAVMTLTALAPGVQASEASRPNIIMVFIDDMGWSDLSCFGGNVVKTAHIDRLAAEGIRFRNFYVNSPICSPSRVALTTGQYPHRWRITSYLARRELNNRRGMAQWLDPRAPALPRRLQAAGYATGHFGKWHMGGQRDVGEAPLIEAYGFHKSLTNFEGLGPRVLPLCDAYNGKPPRKHDLGSAGLGRGTIRWEDRSVVTAAFVTDALAFIDKAQAAGRPFYVNLWPDDVHSPFFPPKALREATGKSKRDLYYAVLKAMDEQLGVLFDRIKKDEKLKNNTLILVASDNGHEEGAGQSAPLRGAKTWLYEGGVRSPLIVWGPGLLAEGTAGTTNIESILCALDLNRSLYTIAGIKTPGGVTLDGEDLSETILGKGTKSRKTPIFWRRPPDRPGTKKEKNPDLAVRHGRWKFYVDYNGTGAQLYDLREDMSEKRNLAESYPAIVDRLKKAVFQWNVGMPADAGDPAYSKSRQGKRGGLAPNLFVNPIGEGADPWVVRDPNADRYLWCFSEGNRGIAVHTSRCLTSLGQKHVVWRAPDRGPISREVWAPELHFLDGRWHIYFAASDGRNENHLAYVLRSKTKDPLGSYECHGPFATGEGADGRSPNIWAIDMTVLEHDGKRYALWSGWDAPGTDRQFLYIAPMASPIKLAGPRVRICANDDHPWEYTELNEKGRGLNEAPQVLKVGGNIFVMCSCGASWLPTYKLGMLSLWGKKNPLDPESWGKTGPVFAGTDVTYGVGHSCFVKSPDQSEWWHVFHAKRDKRPGWRRAVFVQPMHITTRHTHTSGPGWPIFGRPVAPGQVLKKPSAVSTSVPLPMDKMPVRRSLKAMQIDPDWDYYGHQQFIKPSREGLHIGCRPEAPVNDYRSGEKVVLADWLWADYSVAVTIDFLGNAQARDAGILFRTSGASVGYDAQRGYFAGLIPKTNLVILGKTDGRNWTELARAPWTVDPARLQRLKVTVLGSRIQINVNNKSALQHEDAAYAGGALGLRVVDTHAVFSDLFATLMVSTRGSSLK